MAEYFVWSDKDEGDFVALLDRQPALSALIPALSAGVPLGKKRPKSALCRVSGSRSATVGDYVLRGPLEPHGLSVVSERLKELLDREAPEARIEYLPVQLTRKDRSTVAAPYFVANLLDCVPCLDEGKSVVHRSRGGRKHGAMQVIDVLVLDAARIPRQSCLFRLAEFPKLWLVRRDLVEKIVGAKMTGAFFLYPQSYGFGWPSKETAVDRKARALAEEADEANREASRQATSTLSQKQKNLIRRSFFEVGGAKAESFARLESPEQLEYLAEIYNWDDGAEPMRWVVTSPLCDRGTALKVYWMADPGSAYEDHGSLAKVPGGARCGSAEVARAAEQRLLEGKFRHARFTYDPLPCAAQVSDDVKARMPRSLFRKLVGR